MGGPRFRGARGSRAMETGPHASRVRHGLAAVVLLAFAVLCFPGLLRDPTGILVGPQHGGMNDLTNQFVAFLNYPATVARTEGTCATWNPYRHAGAPWRGNPQAMLFYPPNWLFYVFEASVTASWLLVLHHFWAGLGTYLLTRRYGCSRMASLLGGVVFMAAPYYVAHTGEGHFPHVCLVAWTPWAFLAWERVRAEQPYGTVCLVGVLSLAFFCGHAQEFYYLVLILTALVLFEAFAAPFRRPPDGADRAAGWVAVGRPLFRWLLVGAGVVGVVAVDLFPIGVYSLNSLRSQGILFQQVDLFSLAWSSLWLLVDPFAFGGPVTYDGPGGYYWEAVCHFGVVPIGLAGIAVVGAWRRYPVVRCGVLLALCTLFALGTDTPLFTLMYRFVPGVSLFRAPARALFFASFAVSVLAAVGFDTLVVLLRHCRPRSAWQPRPALAAALLGVILAAVVVGIGGSRQTPDNLGDKAAVVGSGQRPNLRPTQAQVTPGDKATAVGSGQRPNLRPTQTQVTPGDNATAVGSGQRPNLRPVASLSAAPAPHGIRTGRVAVEVLAAVSLIVLAALAPTRVGIFAAGLPVLCGLDLLLHSHAVVAVAPQPNLQRVNPIAEFLRQRIGQDRVLVSHRLLSDGEAWRNGIQKLHSYESVPVVRSTMLLGALAYNREPNQVVDIDGWQTAELSQYRQSLLDLAGVRYAVVEGPSRKLPGWRLVAKGLVPDPGLLPPDGRKRMLEYTIYENDARLPRAFVVGRAAAILPRDSSMRRLATLEPRREVLLAQDVLPVGSREPFHAATIRSYRSDRVVVEADLSAPGYLILTDTYYPGWTALVNGKPAPVLPANYAFRAVPLGPGKHVVTFEFAPPGAQPGMILSLLTVAVVVLFSVGNFRSRGPDRR